VNDELENYGRKLRWAVFKIPAQYTPARSDKID